MDHLLYNIHHLHKGQELPFQPHIYAVRGSLVVFLFLRMDIVCLLYMVRILINLYLLGTILLRMAMVRTYSGLHNSDQLGMESIMNLLVHLQHDVRVGLSRHT
jgi:hypothetical protein